MGLHVRLPDPQGAIVHGPALFTCETVHDHDDYLRVSKLCGMFSCADLASMCARSG